MPTIEGAQRPFWMHQVVEYLIGLVLIASSIQLPEPALPASIGVLVLLNAAIAKGGAGAFRLTSRRVHRWLDVVLIVLLLVGAVQPVVEVDSTGRVVMAVMAVVMAFVWANSDFREKPQRKERRAATARPESEEIGRKAGRVVGSGVNAAKRLRNKVADD